MPVQRLVMHAFFTMFPSMCIKTAFFPNCFYKSLWSVKQFYVCSLISYVSVARVAGEVAPFFSGLLRKRPLKKVCAQNWIHLWGACRCLEYSRMCELNLDTCEPVVLPVSSSLWKKLRKCIGGFCLCEPVCLKLAYN